MPAEPRSRRRFKQIALFACKFAGLFVVARWLTRRGLRILCYHAFADDDEHRFRPGLFMQVDRFARRLEAIRRGRYPVLPLDEAVRRLDAADLPACATVITIDDGFPSVYLRAAPLLAQHAFPSTTYVTTYYARHQYPVYRLLVQYAFWKRTATELRLGEPGLFGVSGLFPLRDEAARDAIMWRLIDAGEAAQGEDARYAAAVRLGQLLGADLGRAIDHRVFHVMNEDELKLAQRTGMDLQLHTHRHRFPEDPAPARREIDDNRAALEAIVATPGLHFCYPSGVWSTKHWPVLEAAGIASATTCDPGLNYAGTPKFGLKRFLDSDDITQIEFEAELAGLSELLRRLRARLSRSDRQ